MHSMSGSENGLAFLGLGRTSILWSGTGGSLNMHISSLVFERVGPFKERTEVPCAPLTLLFGQNGAGKSAIIRALLLLKQSSTRQSGKNLFTLTGPDVNYGNIGSLFYGRDIDCDAHIGIHMPTGHMHEWDDSVAFSDIDIDTYHGHEFTFSIVNRDRSPTLIKDSLHFGYEKERLLEIRQKEYAAKNKKEPIAYLCMESLNRENSRLAYRLDYLLPLVAEISSQIDNYLNGREFDLKCLYEDDQRHWKNFLDDVVKYSGREHLLSLCNRLRSYNLDALVDDIEAISTPEVPVGRYGWNPSSPPAASRLRPLDWIGQTTHAEILAETLSCIDCYKQGLVLNLRKLHSESLERLREILGGLVNIGPSRNLPPRVARVEEFQTGELAELGGDALAPEVIERANEAAAHLDLGYKMELRRLTIEGLEDAVALIAHEEKTGLDMTLQDIGYGVSQVFPVLLGAFAPDNQVVAIQQPELHLHPRIQSRIADVFLQASQERCNQFIIETHSEHIVYRIQRHVRKLELDPADVAINWIFRDEDGSHCYPIRLDTDGEFIDEWPGGFFEDGFDDIVSGLDS